jgi:hypothetical protein
MNNETKLKRDIKHAIDENDKLSDDINYLTEEKFNDEERNRRLLKLAAKSVLKMVAERMEFNETFIDINRKLLTCGKISDQVNMLAE